MGRPMGAVESRSRERRLAEQQRLDEAHRPVDEGKPPRRHVKLLRQWERMTDAFHRGANKETK